MPGDAGVVAGGHDEAGAGGHGPVGLLTGEHRARSHQHLRHFPDNGADGVLRRGGTEGDLGGGEAAGSQSPGQGDRFRCVFNGDDGYNADI